MASLFHPSQSLPNELLSCIVLEALRSPRLSYTTDELFIQPKSKLVFKAISVGFGTSCKKFRAILLREWFRVFYAYELIDIERLTGISRGGITSVNINGFVRELYFHQTMELLPHHFTSLSNLHTISYPLHDTVIVPVSSATDRLYPTIPHFPRSIQSLELREALNCSPEEISSIGISRMPSLTRLKVICGESGAWGPIPNYGMGNAETIAHQLAKAYSSILSPLNRLQSISMDVHLCDTTVLHGDPTPVLPLIAPQALNGAQIIPQPVTPQTLCTGDNLCLACWEARRAGSQQREISLTRTLGKSLKRLTTVEWTIWYRQKGHGEEKRRVNLDRHLAQQSATVMQEMPSQMDISRGSPSTTESHEIEDGDIVCTTSRVPLALYPAILG